MTPSTDNTSLLLLQDSPYNFGFPFADSLKALWLATPHRRKLLGIDWGERRVGLAISDVCGIVASPLTILERTPNTAHLRYPRQRQQAQERRAKALLEDVLCVIEKEAPLAVCVGLPLNMNGSAGFQTQRVLTFCCKLNNSLKIPIVLADERLSSWAVERVMLEEDKTRRFRQQHLDKNAAAFVLQGVLDLLNRSGATAAAPE